MDYRLKNLLAKAVMQVCLLLFVVFLAFPWFGCFPPP